MHPVAWLTENQTGQTIQATWSQKEFKNVLVVNNQRVQHVPGDREVNKRTSRKNGQKEGEISMIEEQTGLTNCTALYC
jgi:hypothetical protein